MKEGAVTGIEREIAGEKAAALGRSGRKLKTALDNLRRFDEGGGKGRGRSGAASRPGTREKLVEAAGDALWSYIVQREALGLIGGDYVRREYRVPREVWRQMRPQERR